MRLAFPVLIASVISVLPTTARAADGPTPRTVAIISGVALTVISAGAGTVYSFKASAADLDARNTRAGLEHQFGASPCSNPSSAAQAGCAQLQGLLDDRDSAHEISTVAFVATGVFALSTVAVLVFWRHDAEPRVALAPTLGPGSGAIAMMGRF